MRRVFWSVARLSRGKMVRLCTPASSAREPMRLAHAPALVFKQTWKGGRHTVRSASAVEAPEAWLCWRAFRRTIPISKKKNAPGAPNATTKGWFLTEDDSVLRTALSVGCLRWEQELRREPASAFKYARTTAVRRQSRAGSRAAPGRLLPPAAFLKVEPSPTLPFSGHGKLRAWKEGGWGTRAQFPPPQE